MKLPLLAAALVALTFTACDRPKQAEQAGSATYGTNMEGGGTLGAERKEMGLAEVTDALKAVETDDDLSGPAVLPGFALDGNGNPLKPGQEAHKPPQVH
jgi:hypothetical protein